MNNVQTLCLLMLKTNRQVLSLQIFNVRCDCFVVLDYGCDVSLLNVVFEKEIPVDGGLENLLEDVSLVEQAHICK